MARLRAFVAPLVSGIVLALAARAQPVRIVSTFPSITETLFALGAGDRVIGVSDYCRYPPAALSLPKVGSFTKPDPEKIALLRPDLVIVDRSAGALAERLSALGIHHASVKLGSLADIYSMIRDIGAAIDSPERANQLNANIRSRLAAFRAETEKRPRPSVLIVLGRTPGQLTGIVAVGPGPYLGELLEIAGGRNVLAETSIAYPHISLETVVRLNPDVILDLSLMGSVSGTGSAGGMSSTGGDPAAEERLRQPWLSRRELAAVRDGMIFGLTSEPLTTPGPRVVDAVELLKATIHQKNRQP
jgi:iron complex transport system substrate-binding protein